MQVQGTSRPQIRILGFALLVILGALSGSKSRMLVSNIYHNIGSIELSKALGRLGADALFVKKGLIWLSVSPRSDAYVRWHLRQAKTDFSKAVSWNLRNGRAYRNLGRVALMEGSYAKALENLNLATGLDPSSLYTEWLLGNVYWHLGDKNAARGVWQESGILERFTWAYLELAEKALKDEEWGASIDTINQALEIDPSNAYAYLLLGRNYERMHRAAHAIAAFQKVTALDAPDWMKAESHGRLGYLYRDLGQPLEAANAFAASVEINPEDVWSWMALGNVYGDYLGRWEVAKGYYMEAIEVQPDNAWAHFGLGRVYQRLGALEVAVAELERATSLNSRVVDFHRGLAEAYVALGEGDKAIEEFCAVLNLDSGNDYARQCLRELGAEGCRK